MKKCAILAVMLLAPLYAFSQAGLETPADDLKLVANQSFVGIGGGLDLNFNAYRIPPDENGFEYYAINPHFNFGLDYSYTVTKKFRPRLGFKYVKMSYGMDWGDFNSTFDKLETKVHVLGLDLFFDFLVADNGRMQLFLAPGVKGEMVTGDKNVRIDNNGSKVEVNGYSFIDDEYPSMVAGGALAALARYQINNTVAVTLKPEYTFFLRKYVMENDKAFQRLALNLGVEFGF